MLIKINHIKNVGRFYEVIPKGTAESSPNLEQFNLIYADNATGKTTLAAIIKSLAYNEPSRILIKKTIPGDKNCEISLNIDNNNYNFLNERWNKLPRSKFAIFDEEFIEKNIFSATGIDPDHKRQLFNYVVLGEENINKFQEIQHLSETEIPSINKEISNLESQLKLAANVSDIKTLLEIEMIPSEEIEKLKSSVDALERQVKNTESIKTSKTLGKLQNALWPECSLILMANIDDIGNIEKYKAYITNHQKWIKEGLAIQHETNTCPYCFQNLTDNEIIKAYKQFFSDECQELINHLNTISSDLRINFSEDRILLIEKITDVNNDLCTFWHSMDIDILSVMPFVDKYKEKLIKYRDTLLNLVDERQRNILKPLEISKNDNEILSLSMEISEAIESYNSTIESVNKKIEAVKSRHENLEIVKQQYEKDKQALQLQQVVFYDINTKKLIDQRQNLSIKKQQLTENLNTLRSNISAASQILLEKYQNSINKLLKTFGVEFRINKVEQKVDTTRKDNLVFNIELKGIAFDPNGSRNTPYSLANTLSSGDRSTLAFALFMAKLQDTDLNNTIVVFDDPISSLDFFRKQQTSKLISTISLKTKQTIVLTHSMEFAKLFGHVPVKSKYFKIIKADSIAGVVFTPYNKLSDMCVSKHNEEHETLSMYLSSPASVERIDVMKSIRSYVETKLCVYLPEVNTLSPATLGTFISYIKKNELVENQYLDDIEIINDSIVNENHGGDAQATDYNNLTDDELRNLCKLALDLAAPIRLK